MGYKGLPLEKIKYQTKRMLFFYIFSLVLDIFGF
jgi:hypothetical protein